MGRRRKITDRMGKFFGVRSWLVRLSRTIYKPSHFLPSTFFNSSVVYTWPLVK